MNTYTIFVFFMFYSNVYSVSPKNNGKIPSTASLDRETIRELLKDQEANSEWSHILSRNISFKNTYEPLKEYIDTNGDSSEEIQHINVLNVLQKYAEDDVMNKKVSIDVIRGLVEDATDFAGLMDTNLYAMLILNDLLLYCSSFNGVMCEEEIIDIENNVIRCTTANDNHHMKFNLTTNEGTIKFRVTGNLLRNTRETDFTWTSIIGKMTNLDIYYRIRRGEFNDIFNTSGTVKPLVIDLYEVMTILIFTIRSIDKKLQGACVAHEGDFVNKYEFLVDELDKEFDHLNKDVNTNKATIAIWKLVNRYLSESEDSSELTNSDGLEETDYLNGIAEIIPNAPFLIQQVKFTNENHTILLDLAHGEEENRRFTDATIRTLSFSTSCENSSDDEVLDKQDSDDYCFKGTAVVNVTLS
ncbi:uncharacterized protein LOC126845836 [Adelges cooleyi]|uniref:uncharacterized protein LOC126845836 n=1 Tax=Adelges cooleyi TaxID=133065 RepID=UPI00217F35E0|nr:uncharacterized protein LOC126845836 [Adelges cooleyi]